MGTFYNMLKKYHMEKLFQKENLVILVLAGILLIVIALPVKEAETEKADLKIYEEMEKEQQPENSSAQEAEDYAGELEKRLGEILSRIKGAGKVYVMITLQESEELVAEEEFVVKTIYPKVEGVVVVAEGAGTGKVTQHIIEAIQALFPIELHKIKVTGS